MNIPTHLISSLLLAQIAILPVAEPIDVTTAVAQANGTEDTLPTPAIVKQKARS